MLFPLPSLAHVTRWAQATVPVYGHLPAPQGYVECCTSNLVTFFFQKLLSTAIAWSCQIVHCYLGKWSHASGLLIPRQFLMVCVFQGGKGLVIQHYQLCAHFPAYRSVPQLFPAITDLWDCWAQCRYISKDSKQWCACSYNSIWMTVKRLFHLMGLLLCVCVTLNITFLGLFLHPSLGRL